MFGTVPPIPPPLGTSSGNTGSPNTNRVDTMPTNDSTNTTTTTNVAQNVVDKNLPQLFDYRGGSHVTNVPAFNKKEFTSWKVRFLYKTAKEMWNDLILAHEGLSDTRDTEIAALRLKFNAFKLLEGEKLNGTFTRLKCLLNDLENTGVIIPQAKVNATFVNSHPRKWLSMNQTQRENNSIKNDCLATLYGKYNYKEGLDDQIYESETQKLNIQASCSKALISNIIFRTVTQMLKKIKGPTMNSWPMCMMSIMKELCWQIIKDEGTTKIRAFMAIVEDEPSVEKADARYGQWVDITMKKEPLPHLPKLIGVNPTAVPNTCSDKKVDSSTEKLLLTLMEEVNGLKKQTKIPSSTSPSISQSSSSKSTKQKTWKPRIANKRSTKPTESRHMTGVKQYLHRYSEESGPKVVFGDDSSSDTEGYGSVNRNGITFTRVAYVNGLKHNLISINQLCDA
uniref:Retrovirus-related Pol polyprotein from transposon TNT 1-94 n=1 Tax=Tanacetum cinerariifolium TaxID=118510 RepID=A0A699GUG3_TANCI|nr:retrovirus-related Pol polyprotein from transposon TNT 1-94 [Tanacetum cinerariifolium]